VRYNVDVLKKLEVKPTSMPIKDEERRDAIAAIKCLLSMCMSKHFNKECPCN
jgi:hypothetical protein